MRDALNPALTCSRPVRCSPAPCSAGLQGGSDVVTRTALKRINWSSYKISQNTDKVTGKEEGIPSVPASACLGEGGGCSNTEQGVDGMRGRQLVLWISAGFRWRNDAHRCSDAVPLPPRPLDVGALVSPVSRLAPVTPPNAPACSWA